MIAHRNSENYGPITWVGRFPVYATTVIVAVHVLTMAGCALLMAAGNTALLGSLTFQTDDVLHRYMLWQCVTYAFVHQPSIFFAIEMYMLFVFGREVELFMGRAAYLQLYAALLLLGPVLMLFASPFGNALLQGSAEIHFAIFLAFAALYPGAQILFQLTAKWLAIALFALFGLQLLAGNAWAQLAVLLGASALAIFTVRRGDLGMGFLRNLRPRSHRMAHRPPLRVVRRPEEEPKDIHESIDPLLEKISRQGISSLTRRERELLERARAALLDKEKRP